MVAVRVGEGTQAQELPSYFEGNPWVEILANRGQEDVADLGPVKAPGASAGPAISTASQLGPPASQAPSGQELQQLIGVLTRLVQGQVQVAQAQAQAQPMVVVVPIVIQVPVWPSAELGGHGGITPRPNAVNCALRSRRSGVQIPAGPPPLMLSVCLPARGLC